MLPLWFSGGIKAFTAITPCKILHCRFPCPSPQHLHMLHMSCGQTPHPSSPRAEPLSEHSLGFLHGRLSQLYCFTVFFLPELCARWRPTNGFKRLCMSELSFQTAGEVNDPSPTPCPDCAAGGGMCSGRTLSSGPADFSIQRCSQKVTLRRRHDGRVFRGGSGQQWTLKNIWGGNFLLWATNVPPEVWLVLSAKTWVYKASDGEPHPQEDIEHLRLFVLTDVFFFF